MAINDTVIYHGQKHKIIAINECGCNKSDPIITMDNRKEVKTSEMEVKTIDLH